MARRRPSDPALALDRILKQRGGKTPRPRLSIVIAGDPSRPVRTISLPRLLPTVLTLVAAALVLATVVLACGSWKMRDALSALEQRVRTMVQAADSVALRSADGEPGDDMAAVAPALRAPSGETGHFVVQSANTGEEIEVRLDLRTGEVEASGYRRLRHVMRCLRTGAETPVDPRLIDLLYRIAQRTHQKIVLI